MANNSNNGFHLGCAGWIVLFYVVVIGYAIFAAFIVPILPVLLPFIIIGGIILFIFAIIRICAINKEFDTKKYNTPKTDDMNNPDVKQNSDNGDLMERVDRRYLSSEDQIRDVSSLDYMKHISGDNDLDNTNDNTQKEKSAKKKKNIKVLVISLIVGLALFAPYVIVAIFLIISIVMDEFGTGNVKSQPTYILLKQVEIPTVCTGNYEKGSNKIYVKENGEISFDIKDWEYSDLFIGETEPGIYVRELFCIDDSDGYQFGYYRNSEEGDNYIIKVEMVDLSNDTPGYARIRLLSEKGYTWIDKDMGVSVNVKTSVSTPQKEPSTPLEQAMKDNDMWKGTYPEKYAGVYKDEWSASTITIGQDGMMTFHLDGMNDQVQERFFGSVGNVEFKRQLYLKGHYEYSSAYFRDPENGDYSVVKLYIGSINNVPYFSFSIGTSERTYYQIEDINGNKMNYKTNHSKNNSSSSSSSSNSSGKKQYYNTYDYDPDDYDNPEDYADDAWGNDFDDWDEAYDYWEEW